MFSYKVHSPHPTRPSVGNTLSILYNEEHIAYFIEWSFSCCGCAELSGLGYYSVFKDAKVVDEFIHFIKTCTPSKGSHKSLEVYFCITESQQIALEGLVNHPKVRLIDKYKNKAHGPHHMYLYRISCSGDFKDIPKQPL